MPISVATPRSLPGLAAPLREIVRVALAQEGRRAGEIAIVLAGDVELRELNRRWRGIDRATDVLSFPYGDEPHAQRDPELILSLGRKSGTGRARPRRPAAVSGDLVISLERVSDQAKRYRVSRGRELARLVVHGALHLAGHDHHQAGERRLMRASERKVLRACAAAIRRLDSALVSDAKGGIPGPRRRRSP